MTDWSRKFVRDSLPTLAKPCTIQEPEERW